MFVYWVSVLDQYVGLALKVLRNEGMELTDKIRAILDKNLSSAKYGLYMNKLPTCQTEENNAVENHLKCLLRSTYS